MITALGMVVLVPLLTWVLLNSVDHGTRLTSLETWRGDGRRYTPEDAQKDYGIIIEKISLNFAGDLETQLELKEFKAYATYKRVPDAN
jgi:hypothetical protein